MNKILIVAFIFLVFCMPSFSAESIFVPNITIDVAKKAIISYTVSKGWTFVQETNSSLNFSKQVQTHDPDKYRMEQLMCKEEQVNDELLRKLKIEDAERRGDEFLKDILTSNSNLYTYSCNPSYYNSWTTVNLQFVLSENNGVIISTNNSSEEVKDIFKIVFTGYYDYNIEYKFPLLRKSYILISDKPLTRYEGYNRLGQKQKVIKIDGKNVSSYKKADIEALFRDGKKDKIKLETEDGYITKSYYLLGTFNEPIYKQYLR